MTYQEYKRNSGDSVRGKEGTTNRTIKNNGGEIIEKGETIIFTGKSGRGGFNIRSKTTNVSISQVNYEAVEISFNNKR